MVRDFPSLTGTFVKNVLVGKKNKYVSGRYDRNDWRYYFYLTFGERGRRRGINIKTSEAVPVYDLGSLTSGRNDGR